MTDRHLSPSFQTPERSSFNRLKSQLKADPEMAFSWHCNIACCFMDEGGSRETANRAAARFMQHAFGVDMTEHPNWKDFEKQWATPDILAIPSRQEIIDTLNQWRHAETMRDGQELDNARTNRDKLLAQYAKT